MMKMVGLVDMMCDEKDLVREGLDCSGERMMRCYIAVTLAL